jgi:hypothetical protein
VNRLQGNIPGISEGPVEIPPFTVPEAPMAEDLPLSKEILARVRERFGLEESEIEITSTPQQNLGDLSLTFPFRLARLVRALEAIYDHYVLFQKNFDTLTDYYGIEGIRAAFYADPRDITEAIISMKDELDFVSSLPGIKGLWIIAAARFISIRSCNTGRIFKSVYR